MLLEVESQRGRELALQSQLEEESQRHLQVEGQSTRSLEVASWWAVWPSLLRLCCWQCGGQRCFSALELVGHHFQLE